MSSKKLSRENIHFSETAQARIMRVAWRVLGEVRGKAPRLDKIVHHKKSGISGFSNGVVGFVTDMAMPETMENGTYRQTVEPSVSTGFTYLEKVDLTTGKLFDTLLQIVDLCEKTEGRREVSVDPAKLIETLELFRGDGLVTISIGSETDVVGLGNLSVNNEHKLAMVMPMYVHPKDVRSMGRPQTENIFSWLKKFIASTGAIADEKK